MDDKKLGPDLIKLGRTVTSVGCALTILTMLFFLGLIVVSVLLS